jgi:hypothetical protein
MKGAGQETGPIAERRRETKPASLRLEIDGRK